MSMLAPIFPLITAVTFFSTLTVFYKDNPVYRVILNIITGVALAQSMLVMIQNIQTTTWASLMKGDLMQIIVIALGLLFFTLFIPSLKGLYRTIIIITAAVGLGLGITNQMYLSVMQVQSFASLATTSILWFLSLLVYIFTFTYYIFGEKFAKTLGAPRKIGRFLLLSYTAMLIPMQILGKANIVEYMVLRINDDGTMWIGVVFLVIVMIDAVYGIRKLFGMKQPTKISTSTQTTSS